jgi:phosphatidylserine/phosphatidylglycerophosphate/cardiolipin synthase-like enzyme
VKLRADERGGTDQIQLLILVAAAFVVLAGARELGGRVSAKFDQEAAAVESLEGWDHAVPEAPPGEVAAHQTTTELSGIGVRIVARLEEEHASRRGETWNVSLSNQLVGDWLIDSPTTWTRQAPGANDFLHDEVHDAIVSARRSLVFATLAPPDEPYAATINRALRELSARQPAGGDGVDVRILIGRGDPAALRESLTRGLPAGGPVRVSVGAYGRRGAFSHVKMIASDGERALVGGHNWWAVEYNVEHPVHDVSIRVQGPAARHAEDYFDDLWRHAAGAGDVVGDAADDPPASPSLGPVAPGGGSPIIAVGTRGGISVTTDATSDDAIYAMIDAARRTVRLSQQDLVSMKIAVTRDQVRDATSLPRPVVDALMPPELSVGEQHLAPGLLDHLGHALLRGVTVEIAISTSSEGGNGGYSNGWTPAQVRQAILDHLHELAEAPWWAPWRADRTAAEVAAAEARLTVRGVRTVDGETVRNHAKVVIVDDAAFYTGSQNLYPGGMAEVFWMQLAEFGFIVDDPEKARVFVQTYWDPLWRSAR